MFYFDIWWGFLRFSIGQLFTLSWPLRIADQDILIRGLFSGHVKKSDGSLRLNAFLLNHHKEKALSVSRLIRPYHEFFASLFLKDAARRNVHFYGVAQLAASCVRAVEMDGARCLKVNAAPTASNPFHANIYLPPDKNKDYYYDIARRLVECAGKYIPYESLN